MNFSENKNSWFDRNRDNSQFDIRRGMMYLYPEGSEIEKFRKYGDGNKITSAQKARSNNTDTRKIDMSKVQTSDNNNRIIDREAYAQLQDSLIARNYPFPQRMAILATSMQEGSPGGRGIGGNGYLGLSPQRMDTTLLGNTSEQRAKQITFILDDLEYTHPDNWLDGGTGGIKIDSGKKGYDMFWNTNDVDSATQILNKSYVRPAGRQTEWDNRSKVAKTLGKIAK